MNNSGRGNWFLMFGLFVVGMAVLVGAVAWDGHDVIYYLDEEVSYYHNLSANVTGFDSDIAFAIDTDTDINWTNASGTFSVSASSVSDWLSITDSASGNLTISAVYDNQTGFFVVPVQASNATGASASVEGFEFQINATNDKPEFVTDLSADFNWTATAKNITITALDEEGHYPLNFSLTNVSCTHGASTGRVLNQDCNIFTLVNTSNTTANIGLTPDLAGLDVGVYVFNLSITEAEHGCPHAYCDNATYNVTNSTTTQITLTVLSLLSINASNCTGTVMEGKQFNCTVNVTTVGATDSIDVSTYALYSNYPSVLSQNINRSWFYANNTDNAVANVLSIPISVTPDKNFVGNWTINFSATDGLTSDVGVIALYVNFTESNVTLDTVDDMTLYTNGNFSVNATDRDFLIRDTSVKTEVLTFASNTSWVTPVDATPLPHTDSNYSTATFVVDWSSALLLNSSGGNYSVMINVTDVVGNTDNKTFTIQILNETAPEWNDSLEDPVSLNLTEGTAFTYNVSVNVTDEGGDNITFYYENVSASFCSLNTTNFNYSTGIISFTPTDCDVGYHNVTIIASDLKLNSSHSFNFTVNNIADDPELRSFSAYNGTNTTSTISEGDSIIAKEKVEVSFNITVSDDDFLIPSGQRSSFYNESLTFNVTFTNSSNVVVDDLFNFSYVGVSSPYPSGVEYNASFTSEGVQVDNYTIFVNIADASGTSINRTFYLNVTDVSDPPSITAIDNQSVTIYDVVNFTVNASDEEDDRSDVNNISYSIVNLTVGAPNLTIGNETGVVSFNMSSNSSYAGKWNYTVTVTDNDTNTNSTTLWLYVYGNATLVDMSEGGVFNLTENVTGTLNFTINHSVADNLTYEFWVDSITCSYQNSSNCDYGDLGLRETTSSSGNGSIYGWAFAPNYTDETYGNYKNITVTVYPSTTNLTESQKAKIATNFSFKLNVNHTNAPPTIIGFGSYFGTYGTSTPISIALTDNIRDYDYLDSYYLQDVTFIVSSDEGTNSQIYAEGTTEANQLPWNGTIDSWSLQLYALTALEEQVSITANDSVASAASTPFPVTFTAPSVTVVTTPTSGGGSSTKLKHYSLKLIAPQDIIISDVGFIDIPFSVQNNGQIDLRGISLSSYVMFNDAFSNDVKISLGDNYIENLKFGQSEDFTMRITANTQRAGKYKATIMANVTSPKFSDFADFFIEIKKANESEAEQILIFTDKLVASNAECLELMELLKEAELAFSLGEYSNSVRIARDVAEACEDAIEANEQIRYKVEGFVQDNFYYISFATLAIFFIGFVFYVYKRVRFNKSGMDEYV